MLAQYQNGNCTVAINDDGTKTREYDGEPNPEYPESIDVKITDWCDGGCRWCHEKSTTRGCHGSVLDLLKDCPAGTEIALGGGDTFSHPEITEIVRELSERGLIVNATVNSMHLDRHAWRIAGYRHMGWLRGLGVSYRREFIDDEAARHWDANTVLHVIAGVDDVNDVATLGNPFRKLLILGYKRYGRGESHWCDEVQRNVSRWRYWLRRLVSRFDVVAFDTLATEQLQIRRRIPGHIWDGRYMGDDGKFTMYIDAVMYRFAASSTSPKIPIAGRSVREMFAALRDMTSVAPAS